MSCHVVHFVNCLQHGSIKCYHLQKPELQDQEDEVPGAVQLRQDEEGQQEEGQQEDGQQEALGWECVSDDC